MFHIREDLDCRLLAPSPRSCAFRVSDPWSSARRAQPARRPHLVPPPRRVTGAVLPASLVCVAFSRVRSDDESKNTSVWEIWRGPQPTAVCIDDRTAYRQSQAHAFALRREQGIEDAVDVRWIESCAGVLYRNQQSWPPNRGQVAKVDRDLRRMIHDDDAQTVYG
jgi:hypothetical protein